MTHDSTNRLLYIDVMRGIGMILVVYFHIAKQCFSVTITDCVVHNYDMPVFFFISGFLAYKSLSYWNVANTGARLLGKFRLLVIPTIIFFSLYYYFLCDYNPILVCDSRGWLQFWFTVVLFECFVIYFFICYMTNRNLKTHTTAIVAATLISIIIFHTCSKSARWCTWIDFYAVTSYLPIFLLGTLAKCYFTELTHWLEKWWVLTVIIITFASLLTICNLHICNTICLPQKIINLISQWPLRVMGVIVVFGLFVKFRNSFTGEQVITRAITYVGRRTLDIYLLHFFFTAHVKDLHKHISEWGLASIEWPISIIATSIVVCACLLISEVIRKCKPAGKLIFAAKY